MNTDYEQYEAFHNYFLRKEKEQRMTTAIKSIWVTFRKEGINQIK